MIKSITKEFLQNAKINVRLKDGREFFGDIIELQKADNVVCLWENKENCIKIFPLDQVKEVNIYEDSSE